MTESSSTSRLDAPVAALIRLENPSLRDLRQLPEKSEFPQLEGHVYIATMDSGIIKVGMTTNPQSRIGSHLSNAFAFGLRVTDLWLSPRHIDARGSEVRLIKFGNDHGESVNGGEYFRGIAFTDAVAFAEGFVYKQATREAIEQADEERRAHARVKYRATAPEVLAAALRPPPSAEDIVEHIRASIAAFMGRKADGTYMIPPASFDPDDPNEPEDLLEMFGSLAERKGVPLQQILEMTWAEVHGSVVQEIVRGEVALLHAFADKAGHTHMTEQIGDQIFRHIDERNATWTAEAEGSASEYSADDSSDPDPWASVDPEVIRP